MQFAAIFSIAASLALTTAAPTARTSGAVVTFKGAAGAEYTLHFPVDGAEHATHNALSISSVFSKDINVATQCTLLTVDVPPALVAISADEWQVGPPQTVTAIKCTAGGAPIPPPHVPVVSIEFQGADPSQGAKYTLSVPLDNTVVPTNNALSISTIVTSFQGLPNCDIKYIDFPAALSKIGADTWAVGPPQTIESIACHQ